MADENKSSSIALDDGAEGMVCRRLGSYAQIDSLTDSELDYARECFPFPGFFINPEIQGESDEQENICYYDYTVC